MLVERWPNRDLLLDGTVAARLRAGDVEGAKSAFERLAPLADRGEGDFRDLLLEAHLEAAGTSRTAP